MKQVDQQLCFAAYSLSHSFNRRYRAALKGTGLTYPQYLVITALANGEAPTVTELMRTLHLDYGTVTPLLQRLSKDGIVSRSRKDRDERIVRVSLTQKGVALVEEINVVMKKIQCETGKDEGQLDQMILMLNSVRDNLDAQ